jgi:hypothetical protein
MRSTPGGISVTEIGDGSGQGILGAVEDAIGCSARDAENMQSAFAGRNASSSERAVHPGAQNPVSLSV